MSTKPQTSASSNNQNPSGQSESAKQATRTWAFVIVAVGCLLITGLFEWFSRPADIVEYGKVGQEFYPGFTDPTTATSLTVSVIDPEDVKPLEFSVKQAENGQWVIPSHHNYPADAADQLAETASSVIGIKRGAMVTRWASDHARYGVVDPQTDSVGIDELEGIGKRITLGGKDETVLASYIVGEKVEGEGNRYYVRHPDEDETYIADLDINLTTRFRDWVNTDLLDIASTDVRRIELNDYSFDEIRGTVTGNVQSVLSRDSSSDDWNLAGIDATTEAVNEEAVRETLDTLTNLEIAGVRPKQPGLTADLRIDRDALASQRDADRLTSDLLARGFLLQPNPEDKNLLELIAREGEMFVGTDDGLLYRLYFGRAFTGSDQELEIGLNGNDGAGKDEPKSEQEGEKSQAEKESDGDKTPESDGDSDDGDSDDGDSDDAEAAGKPGRYVFVRVNFDPSLLGEAPTEPVEPKESEELKALAEKVKQAEANAEETSTETPESADPDTANPETADDAAKDDAGDQTGDAEQEAQEQEAKETDAQKLQRLRDEFAAAQAAYPSQLADYQEYQRKLEEGKQKSDDLNRRFALWYYVIPGESFDKLSLNRGDLVKAKESAEGEAGDNPQANDNQFNDNAVPTLSGLSDAVMTESAPLQAPENADAQAPEAAKADQPADQPQPADTPATEDAKESNDAAASDKEPKADASPPAEETPPASEPSEPPAEEPAPAEPPVSEPPAEEPAGDQGTPADAPEADADDSGESP